MRTLQNTIDGAGLPLRVLDLFSGLGGWSRPLRDRGHEVISLDVGPRFGADFTRDILTVSSLRELEHDGSRFDLVLASPPCETFSIASVGHHWRPTPEGLLPRDGRARRGLEIMQHTFELIAAYAPAFYVIENPRGMMRRLAPRPPTTTVWYCRLGDRRAKPTDLWTDVPVRFPDVCRNGHPGCDHLRAPRGSKTGTVGFPRAQRALVPYGLGLTVALAVEYATTTRRAA